MEVLAKKILQELPSRFHKRRLICSQRPTSQLLSSVATIAKSKNSLDSLESRNLRPCSTIMASMIWKKFKACHTRNLYYQCETSQWLRQKREMRKQAYRPSNRDVNTTRQSNGISTALSSRSYMKRNWMRCSSYCKWLSSRDRYYQFLTTR